MRSYVYYLYYIFIAGAKEDRHCPALRSCISWRDRFWYGLCPLRCGAFGAVPPGLDDGRLQAPGLKTLLLSIKVLDDRPKRIEIKLK